MALKCSWSIRADPVGAKQGPPHLVDPEGEIPPAEDPEQTARREFAEILGPAASIGQLQALGEIHQRFGKRVIAFCGEADFDTASLSSNTNGRLAAAASKPFRKSIAPSGSIGSRSIENPIGTDQTHRST